MLSLKTYLDCERGRRAALAAALGVSPVMISQWTTAADEKGSKRIPTDRRPDIERATNGEVTCESLGDEVRWVRKQDATWPWHPSGRPLLDIAFKPAPTDAVAA